MTKEDLIGLMNTSSAHTLYHNLEDKIKFSSIVKIYTTDNDCIKVKGERNVSVIAITPDYISVQFDSHKTDIMFSSITKIEYYGGLQ